MKPREMKPGIYWIGAVDWDRRLFDAMIPLPDGTSYNSYLIKGSEKTALIDAVDPTMSAVLANHLDEGRIEEVDYIIANHAEQDHSGTIPQLLERFPRASVVASPRCKEMLVDLLLIPEERIITVSDRETLSLGDKTLEFIHAPWVHWPETTFTYLRENRILFTCDFLGSHLATSDLFVSDEGQVYEAAKRYYAEIMMPFHTNIQRHLEKLKNYAIDIVAPSHGPLYDNPAFILEAYRSWVLDPPKNMVVLPYVSMHGTTKRMVEYFTAAMIERGITVKQFELTATDVGKFAMALVDAATMVVATPTVLAGLHPAAAYPLFFANHVRPKLKFVSLIGSYGWGGRAVEQMSSLLSGLKLDMIEPVLCKGFPREADFRALDNLAAAIAQKHRENGFT